MKDSRWPKIADDLRERINAGEWAAGEKIPSQRELMEEYNTPSPLDVVRAVAALMAEGLILTEPGAPRRGARVRSRHVSGENVMRRIIDDCAGKEFSSFEEAFGDAASADVRYTTGPATPPVAAALEIPDGTEVLCRRIAFTLDGTPHSVYRSYLQPHVAQALGITTPDNEVPGRDAATWLQAAGYKIGRVTAKLTTRLASPPDIEDLALPRGAPVHELTGIVRGDDGKPLEVSVTTGSADHGVFIWEYNAITGEVE